MTEEQRDYLADLANKVGVRLKDTDNKSAFWASQKIDELSAMPNGDFRLVTDEDYARVRSLVDKTLQEMKKWTFSQ